MSSTFKQGQVIQNKRTKVQHRIDRIDMVVFYPFWFYNLTSLSSGRTSRISEHDIESKYTATIEEVEAK